LHSWLQFGLSGRSADRLEGLPDALRVDVDVQLAQERAAGVPGVVEPGVLGDAGLFEGRFPLLPVDVRVGRAALTVISDRFSYSG
jgi:hypothetical protein